MTSDRLDRLLRAAAEAGEPQGYAALAEALELPPPRIRAVAAALEALMAEDAAAGRPFRAAWACGRGRGGLPAPGFFAAAARLGRYGGPDSGPAAEAFVAAERAGAYARAAPQGRADPG